MLEKTLESPSESREIKPANPKGNQPWIFIRRADAEAPILWLLMRRADSLEKTLMLGKMEGWKRMGWQRIRGLGDIADSMDMSLRKLREIVKDKEAWRAAVHGVAKSQIQLSDCTRRLPLIAKQCTIQLSTPFSVPKGEESFWHSFSESCRPPGREGETLRWRSGSVHSRWTDALGGKSQPAGSNLHKTSSHSAHSKASCTCRDPEHKLSPSQWTMALGPLGTVISCIHLQLYAKCSSRGLTLW